MQPVKIGIVGCGTVSGLYLKSMRAFDILETVACADLAVERACAKAKEFDVPKACGVRELLADPEIEIVVNLTTPHAHAEIGLAVLEADKCLYNEKPLAVHRDDGRRLIELARAEGLLIGGAPDTFLGGGFQTCRKLIDEGAIGTPVAATAFTMSHGPEHWHPDPAFVYQAGGGPLFDMGPYYLTALVSLVGPACRVTGSARRSFAERTITSQARFGTTIPVEVPTHIAGVIDFTSGVVGTIITSFDVWAAQVPHIEIYGSHGTLNAPDPNTFGGPIHVRRYTDDAWSEVPLTHGYTEQSRGIGVADMAYALRSGRPHRANGELAYHILDIMHAFYEASSCGQHVELSSTCERPLALPTGLAEGSLDP